MRDSLKFVPFTVVCPEIKPGQGVKTREIQIPVIDECGLEILTPEAHDRIDMMKMQMMLTRITECLHELYATVGKLPSGEPKATADLIAQGCTNSTNIEN